MSCGSVTGQLYLSKLSQSKKVQAKCIVNPRRACAARVTVVVPCVCVCVFPRPSSATRATKRQTRHTGDLSIVFASV